MKKQKVNLKRLTLHKNTVSSLHQNQVSGGAPRSLGCPGGMSVILNCTTTQDPTRPLITIDPEKELCRTIFNSCKSYCPFC